MYVAAHLQQSQSSTCRLHVLDLMKEYTQLQQVMGLAKHVTIDLLQEPKQLPYNY